MNKLDPIYVFGHRNPDTDSIVSSMAYAALHNALGDGDYQAVCLGRLNDETSFLLERFGFAPPPYLPSVRTQVRDIAFDHPATLSEGVPLRHAWDIFRQSPGLYALPVTTEDGGLYGMLTTSSVAEWDMDSIERPEVVDLPVCNLLSALEGHIINADEDVFSQLSGEVTLALPTAGDCLQGLRPGGVVICGQQEDVVERALQLGAGCIILCQSSLAEKYRGLSSPTCMIATPYDAYRAARLLYQALPVGRVARTEELSAFRQDDYIDDVQETVLQTRHRSYPVLDEAGKVIGTLGRYHLLKPRRKQVVLMDHNERAQSVPGLEQADILAIIDHHRLADVQTGNPVFMRNEPVGSTTTIVATMYQEMGLMPPARLAGLMAGAILSDTVLFKSPTCTPKDRRMAERLARIAGVDLDGLGKDIFSQSAESEKSVAELLATDFKEFHIAGHSLGIGQITCLDTDRFLIRLPELLPAMEAMQLQAGYDMQLLMLTDVLREGTELVFLGDEEVIRMAFGVHETAGHHVFLPKVVSRKKQIVPALALLWG